MATSKTPPSLALADTPSVLSTPDPRHPPTSRYQSLRDAAVHLRPRGDFTGQTFAVLVFNPAYDNTVGTYEESDPRNVWFTAKGVSLSFLAARASADVRELEPYSGKDSKSLQSKGPGRRGH
jgi:hypothetical protein